MNPYQDILNLKKTKCTASQVSIRSAFLKQYKEKRYYEISVKKLCERAHVARTTFYANYTNIDSLLAEIEDDLIVELLQVNIRNLKNQNINNESFQFTQNLYQFVSDNHSTLKTLLILQPDIRLIDKWKKAVKYHFWDFLYKDSQNKKDSDLVLEMIASMAVGAYTYLLKDFSEVSQHEITQRITAALHALEY